MGTGAVLTVNWRVKVSTPAQPAREAVRVKVVVEPTVKTRVPPDAATATVAPVTLSVIVALSAFVLAQVRFTELPGGTQ